jgi:hypothetical protein
MVEDKETNQQLPAAAKQQDFQILVIFLKF